MERVYSQRLNPVISLKSGIAPSAATFASYQLFNPGDGVVNRDGIFDFKLSRDLCVKIRYQNFSDSVVVGYQAVQQMK